MKKNIIINLLSFIGVFFFLTFLDIGIENYDNQYLPGIDYDISSAILYFISIIGVYGLLNVILGANLIRLFFDVVFIIYIFIKISDFNSMMQALYISYGDPKALMWYVYIVLVSYFISDLIYTVYKLTQNKRV